MSAAPAKASARRSGRELERTLAWVFEDYGRRGLARLVKAEPPTLTLAKGRILHLANPFLDFVGCAAGGRLIALEAKMTAHDRLERGPKGLTAGQEAAALAWAGAGALVAVVWQCPLGAAPRALGPEALARARADGRRSFAWAEALPLEPGEGRELWRVLDALTTVNAP